MAKTWFEEKHITPRERQMFEEERAVLLATEEILHLMQKEGITKADLAKALGKSKAYVTQALAGGRNMTLRTLAAFAWACGYSIRGLDLVRIEMPTIVVEAESRKTWLRWPHLKLVQTQPPAGVRSDDLLELAA
jgi:transcriptional regulator with XRE-family HTH domain